MVCNFVKFATLGVFAICASAHFNVAQNILATFATFAVGLESPSLLGRYS